MKRESSLFVESSKGNLYIYDLGKKEIFPCHKLIKSIYEIDVNRAEDEDNLINKMKSVYNDIDEKEIRLYVKKYLSLRRAGYFSSSINSVVVQYSSEQIQRQIENVDIVVLEVTEGCNLNCAYCINGKMYNSKRKIEHKLHPESAHAFMEYLLSMWKKSKRLTKRIKQIGFYGGEPLMNISLIKDVVQFCEENTSTELSFEFRMTTNATLLDKYMDYLVQHNFKLTISLDGDKNGQSYRLYANGRNSFESVYKNLKSMMIKFPDYWQNNVSFNSVLHNRNKASSIHSFIYNEFGKVPEIHPLNSSGVMPNMMTEFKKMYRSYEDEEDKQINKVAESRFMSDPRLFNLAQFLLWYSSNDYYDYKSLLCAKDTKTIDVSRVIKTGTCVPFSRKIYLSAQNKIYPCERICDIYHMGEIDSENRVVLNASDVAEYFNTRIRKLSKLCNTCYLVNGCYQCMFQLDGMAELRPVCHMHMSKQQACGHIRDYIDYLENGNVDYNRLLNEGALK